MITALGIIFKLVIGNAIGVVKFAIEHWRIVLPAIVIIVAAWHYLGLRAERDSAIKDLNEYVMKAELEKAAREAENAALRKRAESDIKNITEIHAHNLEAVKHEYLKKQKLDSVTIGNLRNQLRDTLESSTFRVPESPSNPEEYSKSERECYAAYSTLESACKITTLDFNAIRSWADVVCQTVGCEESR